MRNKIREAREVKGISANELAGRMQIHPSTLLNWESGRRQITADKLMQLADILGLTVDFLLGRDSAQVPLTESVDKSVLITLHGQPVWASIHGWMLVNAVKNEFITRNSVLIQFDDVVEPLYLIPPVLSFSLRGTGKPLCVDHVLERSRIWLEPISPDPDLAAELRGWYDLREKRFVQNEFGNRFYICNYGVKWLAFDNCL